MRLEELDRSIRELLPHYDEMMAAGMAVLARLAPPEARILDLGAGSGRAAEAMLRHLPGVTVELLEIDAGALALARTRLAPFGERALFRQGSFHDALPAADAIVASLSLHHVLDTDSKTELYRRVLGGLPAGGALLCFDVTCDGPWARPGERYLPVADELAALRAAGSAHPECFWEREPLAVYGAKKLTG